MARRTAILPRRKKKTSLTTRAVGGYAQPGTHQTYSRTTAPKVVPTENGVRVTNTERLTTSGLFGNASPTKAYIPINPASSSVFPWLSSLTKNYSMYRWNKLTISYVPYVGTTTDGYVELGVFYEYEDAVNWFNSATNNSLSFCAQYATGPGYAGGALCTDVDTVGAANWLGVGVDVKRAHLKYPWFNVDPAPGGGTPTPADYNIVNTAWLGTVGYKSTASSLMGIMFVSYDIELIHPSVSDIQQLTIKMANEDGPVPGFPPVPPPTQDKTEEDSEPV